MNAPNAPRSLAQRLLLIIFILAAICVGVSYLTAHLVLRSETWQHDDPHGHDWLSQELGLTPEEAVRIDTFDAEYRSQRAVLLKTFHQRITALSELLRTHERYSPEVTEAVHQLHLVHGQLQTLSIEHYYDMLSVLPPDKQAKLRDLAVEALSQPE
jgi:hypothetical protein